MGLIGSVKEIGEWLEGRQKKMTLFDKVSNKWRVRIEIPLTHEELKIEYKYVEIDKKSNKILKWEDYEHQLKIDISFKEQNALLIDKWKEKNPVETVNRSSALQVIRKRSKLKFPSLPRTSDDQLTLFFQLNYYNFQKEEDEIFISGSSEEMGSWQIGKSKKLEDDNYPILHTSLVLPKANIDTNLNFTFFRRKKGEVKWEKGERNRKVKVGVEDFKQFSLIRIDCGEFEDEENWKASGISVPLFSLRSEKGIGVGEFEDIKLLVDLAVKLKIQFIQLLPLNDTRVENNWKDSSPYNAVSVFALHPLYLRLSLLPHFKQFEISEKRGEEEEGKYVEYEKIMEEKMRKIRQIGREEMEEMLEEEEYKYWFSENEEWLRGYSVYMGLKEKNRGNSNFHEWHQYSEIEEKKKEETLLFLSSPLSPIYEEVILNYFIQFNCYKQLKEVSLYASSHHIALKGDLPYGFHPLSSHTWLSPQLFLLHSSAGVPPDRINEEGQNWGFPLYNWEEMEKEGFKWWKMRIKVLSYYFHSFRIDHVLGFFRIWEIPNSHNIGYLGKFNPAIGISEREFKENGINDLKRLILPFTTKEETEGIVGKVCTSLFSHLNQEQSKHFISSFSLYILFNYFHSISSNFYLLKEDLYSVEKLKLKIKEEEEEKRIAIEEVLLGKGKLFANRILIEEENNSNYDNEDENKKKYHFRVEMGETSSFECLEEELRNKLKEMYNFYFDDLQQTLWAENALKRLPLLQSSNLLVCAEDLGSIPKCVEGVLEKLCIMGLRIQRFSKKKGEKIENPLCYPYFTVASPSVHDLSTLRGWWKEDKEGANILAKMLGIENGVPEECEPYIIEKILEMHFAGPALLVIISIQDFFSLENELRIISEKDERINLPFVRFHYWRYRIPFTLESLCKNQKWINKISDLLVRTSRATPN